MNIIEAMYCASEWLKDEKVDLEETIDFQNGAMDWGDRTRKRRIEAVETLIKFADKQRSE